MSYVLRVLKRIRVDGVRCPVGGYLLIPPGKLRVASWLCANGSARPADADTALDVELFQRLRDAIAPNASVNG